MEFDKLAKKVFDIVHFKFEDEIEVSDKKDVYVKYDGRKAIIGGENQSFFCRGCLLLVNHLKKGEHNFEVHQTAAFDKCGVMIDMSRNAVMTVPAVKRYIDHMAALGMNLLMLYTEDTYEIKEYPYFGYMRGRYSDKDLREIDSYAGLMGVEVVPCIQTLAHLSQYLKYKCTDDYKDTDDILLIDEEKTYEFIETQIKTVSGIYTSKNIHIGMDEAFFVGVGKYLAKHGYEKRYTIMNRHLKRVSEICNKYGRKPVMWSDMFFRLISSEQDYTPNAVFPQEFIVDIPNVGMMYWDYYHSDEAYYMNVINAHKQLKKEIMFAGGLGSWYGFLPWFSEVLTNTNAALAACKKENIKTIVATMWGDDGNETNAEYLLSLLPIYSEHCYGSGSKEEIEEISSLLTGIPFEITEAIDCCKKVGDTVFSLKEWVYTDVLYDIGKEVTECDGLLEFYEMQEQRFMQFAKQYKEREGYYKYIAVIFGIARIKSALRIDLRKKYRSKNMGYLSETEQKTIPALIELYKELYKLHKEQWEKMYKPFGWEVLSFRYGGILQRLTECRDKLKSYVSGETESIPELEENALHIDNFYEASRFVSPSGKI